MENVNYIRSRESVNFLHTPHPLFKIDASLSPYAGCDGGCVYCPFGFEKNTGVKTDFLYNLGIKLSGTVEPAHLGLGSSCEPYCALEPQFNITRNAVEMIARHEFPLQIFTKSQLVLRDLNLLKGHSARGLLAVSVSVMTCDREIAEIFEPSVIPPAERLEIIKELNKNDVFAGAVLAPIIPYISDSPEQLEEVFERVKRAGGQYILPSALSAGSPASFENFKGIVLSRFPNIFHRIENIYENSKYPVVTYTERINDLLQSLSLKYNLPLYLPVEKSACAPSGIRQELLK